MCARRTAAALIVLSSTFLAPRPARAQRLPQTVVPQHYTLNFSVDLDHARFEGTETIQVLLTAPARSILLNAADIVFQEASISIRGSSRRASVSLDAAKETAALAVDPPLPAGPAEIHVRYTGTLNEKLRGLYLSTDKGRRYAVTQFESTDARRAFPCFDEPAFKATFDIAATVDRNDTAISNGKTVADTESADRRRHTVKFATTPKMSTYLVALAVGGFECVEGASEGVPIRVCTTVGKKDLGRLALDDAQQILRFYNGYLGIKYPFGKLDMVAVPDFAAGAMENTGAIFYRETDLLADEKQASLEVRKNVASVVAHEMAHQWFGDLVTMQWWDDIWLNEGFATWMANRPLAALHPEWNIPVDEAGENQKALTLDGLKSTRPVHARVETPSEIEEAFDAIAYEKGASVLRMIERYLGPETFRSGINAYLKAHAYGNATSQDLWTALTEASGKPIDRILPSFVNQPGAPLVDVGVDCARGARTEVTLAQERFFSDPALLRSGSSERWQVPVCVKGDRSEAAACDVLADAKQTIAFGSACAPWVFANAGAQGYYRTAYTPAMLRAIAPHVQEALTAPERLIIAGDEWALVRAGRHTAADYLTLSTGFAREHTSGVLEAVTDRLGFIHEYLTTDATRPQLETFVRSLVRPLFDELGFAAKSTDTDDRKALRAVVVGALGGAGRDASVIAEARQAADHALRGEASLDPTLARTIVGLAAANGNMALYDAIMAASERATSPEERYLYLYSTANFADPMVIDRALAFTLTPKLRTQDAASYFAHMLGHEAARPRTWAFLKEHWTELQPKVVIFGGDTTVVSSLSSFCDARARDDIKGFFGAHPLPSAARTLTQTLERIDNCIELRAKQAPVVAEWLGRQ